MKKIVLPTDFSNNARNAIVYALEFFKDEKCEFHILHTYTPTFYRLDYMMGGPTYSAIPDMGVDIAQAGLEKTLIDIKSNFDNPKHTFKTLSAFNTLTNEIIELTETKDFDLVVMGTQGATGAKEIFLGSHTVNVIRKSNIPVIAIPSGFLYKTIKSVVFPTDYKSLYKKNDLRILLDLIKTQKAKLTVLHIKEEYDLTEEQETNKKALADSFRDINHVFVEERGKLMPEAVHEYCIANESELLVMFNRRHSFLERWLYKQNVDSIGFHTTVPLLVMCETSQPKSKTTTS